MGNITERIKTFDDAVKELGDNHPLVKEYQDFHNKGLMILSAFVKLRIITAALNEGWKPQYTENEYRYYPHSYFYTEEEYDKMSVKKRAKLISFGVSENEEYSTLVGLASAASFRVPYTLVCFAPQLCFKTRELADYMGNQFIDIFYDFHQK